MSRATATLAVLALSMSPAFASLGCGDVNGDGQMSIIDALVTAQYAAGTLPLAPDQLLRADLNGDSAANILDGLLSAQRSASLPVTIRCIGMMQPTPAPTLPPASHVFVAIQAPTQLTIADRATAAVVANLPLPQVPAGLAADPVRDIVYIAYGYSSMVGTIDSATLSLGSSFSVPGLSGHIDVSRDGSTLVGITSNGIAVVDLPARTVRHQVSLTGWAYFLSITPDSQYVWVNDTLSNAVVKISLATGAIEATVTVGSSPYGVDVSTDGTRVFVINHGEETLSRIDTATNLEILPRQPVGWYPMAVLGHTNSSVYAVNCISSNVTQHDGVTGQQTGVYGVGQEPIQIQEMAGGDVAVVNSGGYAVTIIDPATGGRRDIATSGNAVDAAGK